MDKCKLQINEEVFLKEGKPVMAQGQHMIVKHCLNCGKEFATLPSTNFILCKECGKL